MMRIWEEEYDKSFGGDDESVVGIRWSVLEVYDKGFKNTGMLSEEYNESVRMSESVGII